MSAHYLLSLEVPKNLEDALQDCLMNQKFECEVASFSLEGLTGDADNLTLLEQVSGRKKKVVFLVEATSDEITQCLSKIRSDFSGKGLSYRVMPLERSGPI